MTKAKQADVVIIGGGVLGTSAAFHLSTLGNKRIVLLDRGPIASGTTPFAAGQTSYLNRDPVALKFGVYCIDFFEHFEERTGYPIDFRQCGSLRIALTEKYQSDLEACLGAAQEAGHEAMLISDRRARELVPTLKPPADCRILFIPRDCYVEPKSVAVAYASAARDRGVAIHTQGFGHGNRSPGGPSARGPHLRRSHRNTLGRAGSRCVDTSVRPTAGTRSAHRSGPPSGFRDRASAPM